MIRCCIALMALLMATEADARTVAVRSGEHDGFSRLVIYFSGATDWTLDKVDGGYSLRPGDPGTTYDLTRVFQFIRRDRIAKVEGQPDGALFIAVDCACRAEISEHLGKAVVDIRDGIPDADDMGFNETGPSASMPELNTVANAVAGVSGDDQVDPAIFQLPPDHRPLGSALAWNDLELSPPLGSEGPVSRLSDASETARRAALVGATQTALIAQIARAASEGLVSPAANPSLPQGPPTESADLPGPVMTEHIATEQDEGPRLASLESANVRIETAFERGELSVDPPDPQNAEGDACLESNDFNLAEWGRPLDQEAAIAEYRSGLVGEFDSADPASIAGMTRYYIYMTFGAEAKSLLASFRGRVAQSDLLTMLAEIMDEGESAAFPQIASQISCESTAALWAILAAPDVKRADRISRPAILSAFSGLPVHLRRHLGPALAEWFLLINDTETAATIRNLILQAPGSTASPVKMMEAQLAMDLGEDRAGEAILSQVIDENSSRTPEAVVGLIESNISGGRAPDADLVNVAKALAFEARGTDIGARLTIAALRAMAHEGEIIGALDELEGAIAPFQLEQGDVDVVRQEALELAVRSGTDATFLKAVLRGPLALGNAPRSMDIRRQVAARLNQLELFSEARAVLSETPDAPGPPERLLYAESFVGEGRPGLAIGYLAGLMDEEAMSLRAKAHLQAEEFERAGQLFETLEMADDHARAVWRAQDFAAIRSVGSGPQRAVAMLVSNDEAVPGEARDPITLAESEGILSRSREMRSALGELMDAMALP